MTLESLVILFSVSAPWVLLWGFLLGFKHAVEADHLAAVSTIVTERKSLLSSAVVGGLWGLGHTISLVVAGVLVLLLDFQISEQSEKYLEAGVGLMLIVLGLNVLRKIAQGARVHFHPHQHGSLHHAHPHLHEAGTEDETNSHHGFLFSPKAVIIGMVHGLAGSAALMLLLIPAIDSKALGLIYIIVFGVGSIGGMMLMSVVVGLPFHFTAWRLNRFNLVLQALAGLVSVGLGLTIFYDKIVL